MPYNLSLFGKLFLLRTTTIDERKKPTHYFFAEKNKIIRKTKLCHRI